MRIYEVTLMGKTPLLMHADNIEWADQMDRWKTNPDNKAGSKAGDDRSPAFRWIGCLYHDEKRICIPSDNLMRCLMEGGAMVPVGSGKKTFKSQTQSGCMVGEAYWPLRVAGKEIGMDQVRGLMGEKDFQKHQEFAASAGFLLYLKRAKIGNNKHIRVRPRFDTWATSGTLNVWDEQLTLPVLTNILKNAGQYKGLCDWRPGGKTPGPWGMFETKIREA